MRTNKPFTVQSLQHPLQCLFILAVIGTSRLSVLSNNSAVEWAVTPPSLYASIPCAGTTATQIEQLKISASAVEYERYATCVRLFQECCPQVRLIACAIAPTEGVPTEEKKAVVRANHLPSPHNTAVKTGEPLGKIEFKTTSIAHKINPFPAFEAKHPLLLSHLLFFENLFLH